MQSNNKIPRLKSKKSTSQQREIHMILQRLALALVLSGLALPLPASAQTQGETMQKYVIERDIPGAGSLERYRKAKLVTIASVRSLQARDFEPGAVRLALVQICRAGHDVRGNHLSRRAQQNHVAGQGNRRSNHVICDSFRRYELGCLL